MQEEHGRLYQNELTDLKAPAELIIKMKSAAAKELKKQVKIRKMKKAVVSTAAAVIFLAVIYMPISGNYPSRTGVSMDKKLGITEEVPKEISLLRTQITKEAADSFDPGTAQKSGYRIVEEEGLTVYLGDKEELNAWFVYEDSWYQAVNESGDQKKMLEDILDFVKD